MLIVAGASIAVGLAVGFAVLNKRMRKVEPPAAVTATAEVAAPAAAPPVETEQSLPLSPEATLMPSASASGSALPSALHPLARPEQHGGKTDKTRKDAAKDSKPLDPSVMFDRPRDAGAHPPKGPYDEPETPPAPPPAP